MKRTIAFFIVGCLIGLIGCNRAPALPSDLPKLVACTVTLTQDGAPLADATVSFASAGGGAQQWIGGGKTDAAGKVDISTNGRYPGAPEGKFKVVVTKMESDDEKIPPRPEEGSPEFGPWMNKYQNWSPTVYSSVEKQYADSKTTPLEIDISGSKPIVTTFDVGKKVRLKIN